MKIITGPDPLHPAPPELGQIFTVADARRPIRLRVVSRDNLHKLFADSPGARRPRVPSDSAYNRAWAALRKFAAKNPDLLAKLDDWWARHGHDAPEKLAKATAEKAAGQPPTTPPPPDTGPLGTPGQPPANPLELPVPPLQPAKFPPYTIGQSAAQAALWLAEHWPEDVADQGAAAFLAARKAEVLAGNWNPRYWQALDRLDPQACKAVAYNDEDPDWDTPPFNDPDRHKAITTYSQASDPYPLPPPYSTGDQPSPGWAGAVIDQVLSDTFHAAWIENFAFPEPYDIADLRPVFLDTHSHHYVDADLPPSRVQFGTYSLPLIYSSEAAEVIDHFALPLFGRRYNWTSMIPPGGAGPYHGHMKRHFVQDCRVFVQVQPSNAGQADRLRVKLAPLAAMGRYYGHANAISTEYLLEDPAAYVAKTGNPLGSDDFPYLGMTWRGTWNAYVTIITPVPYLASVLFKDTRLSAAANLGIPGINAIMPAQIAAENTSGKTWKVPFTGGAAEVAFVVNTKGPIMVTDQTTAPEMVWEYNQQTYGPGAGGVGASTNWQTPDGVWHTLPGNIPMDRLRARS